MKNSRPNKGTGAAGKPLHPNSTKAQLLRLLAALQGSGQTGVSTIQARERLAIISPAKIIHSLRHDYGCLIVSVRQVDIDCTGCAHRVAFYVLVNDNGISLRGI